MLSSASHGKVLKYNPEGKVLFCQAVQKYGKVLKYNREGKVLFCQAVLKYGKVRILLSFVSSVIAVIVVISVIMFF